MQILSTKTKLSTNNHLVIMFGLGMIGSAIRGALLDFEYYEVAEIDFDWQSTEKRNAAFSLIETTCVAISPSSRRISVVWSAGIGTFNATQEELNKENIPFMETVKFISMLRETCDLARLDFHFISSAGGLFEGQRVINDRSRPDPVRPYGRLKLEQEQVLRSTFNENEIAIYRPSSVYGSMPQKTGQGLINNLVSNGRRGRVTVLDSHVMTLRDYVFAGDIGNFIAKRVRSGVTSVDRKQVHFLVSSRCSSIFEVVRQIEQTLHMNLQYRYDESFGNSRNITFSDSVLSPDWSPSTLGVGIRQFLVGKNVS